MTIHTLSYRLSAALQLLEQRRSDGELVAASQAADLLNGAEGGAHHNSLDTVLLVVGVDGADTLHTGIFKSGISILATLLLHVPVTNTTHEGGNEGGLHLSSSNSLAEGEHKGKVAVNAFGLEDAGSFHTFPGTGDLLIKEEEWRYLDQNAILGDTFFFVHLNQGTSPKSESSSKSLLLDHGFLVEAEASIHFSGNETRDNFKNSLSEQDAKLINKDGHHLLLIFLLMLLHNS